MMVWTVILENEDKIPVRTLSAELYIGSPADFSHFKLLKYLDPYGDTIFNRLQMDDFIQDVQKLMEIQEYALLGEVRILADLCKSEPHTYLCFYGD
jgi:hypothetical protein